MEALHPHCADGTTLGLDEAARADAADELTVLPDTSVVRYETTALSAVDGLEHSMRSNLLGIPGRQVCGASLDAKFAAPLPLPISPHNRIARAANTANPPAVAAPPNTNHFSLHANTERHLCAASVANVPRSRAPLQSLPVNQKQRLQPAIVKRVSAHRRVMDLHGFKPRTAPGKLTAFQHMQRAYFQSLEDDEEDEAARQEQLWREHEERLNVPADVEMLEVYDSSTGLTIPAGEIRDKTPPRRPRPHPRAANCSWRRPPAAPCRP
jgi:hypothetical protein